ncbi:MAG: hypothetical protein ABFS32_21025 [Bacteroidota bacterium]
MENNEILNIINEFEKDFKSYKDSGRSLIKQLSLNLNRADETNRKRFIDFFLEEIRTNKNNLWSLCLEVIVEANLVTVSSELESIYLSYSELKDENWREDMIMAMLRLNYEKPDGLYNAYIMHHLENQTGRAFFLIVQYCRVNFTKGINLLSDYYANKLLSKDSPEYKNQHHIGYLIHWLINSPYDCLPEIIKQTGTKSKIAGNYLKQNILSFLKSGQSSDIKNNQAQENIRTINEVII